MSADHGLISVTIPAAAKLTGISVQSIRRAIDKGDLVPRYPTTRPVLMWDEVKAWVDSAPTEH